MKNKEIIIEEHEVSPKSYMAFSNLKNIINDSHETLSLLNEQDDLPQWVDEQIATAKDRLRKALDYIRSEKQDGPPESEIEDDVVEAYWNALEGFSKTAASKYDHIDFKPPQSVADAAERGLELRKKNKGKGGLNVQQAAKEGIGSGVARAVSLKNRNNLSPSTVKRMKSFFARHQKNNKVDKGKSPSEDRGRISHLLWGGDAGKAWAEKVCRQMEAADKKK